MRRIFLAFILALSTISITYAQKPSLQVRLLTAGPATNLRGLSSTDGQHIWASGSAGWIGYSKDAGKSWSWQQPAGFKDRDFRDIAALGGATAVTLGIDTPAVILKTKDGGLHWKLVYKNDSPGMFLDAMDFAGIQNGIVVGDPIDGQVFLARTNDGGDNWYPFKAALKDSIIAGEAFFAASGSNIHLNNNGDFTLPSGGAKSRLWKSHQPAQELPIQQGVLSAGPNGMAVNNKWIAIVGGDYTRPTIGDSCFALSYDAGDHWEPYHKLPGYGSAVAFIQKKVLVACGLTGVWITRDGGKSWKTIDKKPFNTLLYLPKSKQLFLAGPKGTIGVLDNF